MQTLLCICYSIGYNGPAVCFSRRYPTQAPGIPSTRGTLARKLSRRAPRERSEQRGCKEGEPAPQELGACGGALFAVMVQILLSITSVAIQV